MLSYLSQKNLFSSSFLVLSLFLLSSEAKSMKEEIDEDTKRIVKKNQNNLILEDKVFTHNMRVQNYNKYWEKFLPEMAESFRKYNRYLETNTIKTDREILELVFQKKFHEGQYPSFTTARTRFSELYNFGRPYASPNRFNPPKEALAYDEYWEGFLPKMAESFREYNNHKKQNIVMSDHEILEILFGKRQRGVFPDFKTAKEKFSVLAKSGRTYAKLFDPPEEVPTYEEYWKEFLPEMAESFRKYNRYLETNTIKTDREILEILFGKLKEGQYPDFKTATEKFSVLAKSGRAYAKLFDPPFKKQQQSQLKKLFPNGMGNIDKYVEQSIMEALQESTTEQVENAIKATTFLPMENIDDETRAGIVEDFLKSPLTINIENDPNEYIKNFNEKKEYIEKLFPNGIKKVSTESYLKFIDAMFYNSNEKVQAVLKYKDLFTQNIINDELKIGVFSYGLNRELNEIEELAYQLQRKEKYITAFFPKEIKKISPESYMNFMISLAKSQEEQAQTVLKYKDWFIPNFISDELKADILSYGLNKEPKEIEEMAELLGGKEKYIIEFFPEKIKKISTEVYIDFLRALGKSDGKQIQAVLKSRDAFFTEVINNQEKIKISSLLLNKNNEKLEEISNTLNTLKKESEEIFSSLYKAVTLENHVNFLFSLGKMNKNEAQGIVNSLKKISFENMRAGGRSILITSLLKSSPEHQKITFKIIDETLKIFTNTDVFFIEKLLQSPLEGLKTVLKAKGAFFTNTMIDEEKKEITNILLRKKIGNMEEISDNLNKIKNHVPQLFLSILKAVRQEYYVDFLISLGKMRKNEAVTILNLLDKISLENTYSGDRFDIIKYLIEAFQENRQIILQIIDEGVDGFIDEELFLTLLKCPLEGLETVLKAKGEFFTKSMNSQDKKEITNYLLNKKIVNMEEISQNLNKTKNLAEKLFSLIADPYLPVYVELMISLGTKSENQAHIILNILNKVSFAKMGVGERFLFIKRLIVSSPNHLQAMLTIINKASLDQDTAGWFIKTSLNDQQIKAIVDNESVFFEKKYIDTGFGESIVRKLMKLSTREINETAQTLKNEKESERLKFMLLFVE